jgi:hypothetical protein
MQQRCSRDAAVLSRSLRTAASLQEEMQEISAASLRSASRDAADLCIEDPY